MRQWDVWQLDQGDSRENTDPRQPVDQDQRPKRYYVLVSSNAHINQAQNVTCIPVQTAGDGIITCVPISRRPSGLDYDSYAWCNTIYTIPKQWFIRKTGYVNKNEQQEIQYSICDYLGIDF